MHHSLFMEILRKNPMEKEGKLWPQYSRVVQLYATLNTEDSSIGFGPRATTCAFWNEMIPTISKHERISLGFVKIIKISYYLVFQS